MMSILDRSQQLASSSGHFSLPNIGYNYQLERRLGRMKIRYGFCEVEDLLPLPVIELQLSGPQPVAIRNKASPFHLYETFGLETKCLRAMINCDAPRNYFYVINH
jgi:hypothetical protein